ncbi:Acetyl-CoA hydrolase/transferase [Caballeronia calidae]|uniref:Acetyl-CoA hydrolase/transferase n=1 Tax=Caballeronia calidae TaxID=1777139 RepID=A0A158E4G5_9BURK|nr:acetyl-CoA hydrolase/transferase C-terminal domain-containing protein [Caballeronia calidae]SAL01728.1 Acetyl-CoA hydrolase/transferase [Caballeronia calidae]
MPVEIDACSLNLPGLIRPGDTVIWSQGTSEPLALVRSLIEQRYDLGGRVRVFLGSSYAEAIAVEHADCFDFVGIGAVGRARDFARAGVLDIIPCHLSDIPRFFSDGTIPIDVVFLQAAQRGDGSLSFGPICSYLPAAVRQARVVIAEVNAQAPWSHSSATLDIADVDFIVRSDYPIATLPRRSPSESDRLIAQRVGTLIPDKAILQLGIGSLPDAILGGLTGHRELGLHSGILSDAMVDLVEQGVVTNATKPVDCGISVTGGVFGSQKLYDFVHENPLVRVDPIEYTHSISVLAQFPNFVAVNSTIEVDLTGQVNGETAAGHYLGTVGGLTDFSRAASIAPGGRSIIALPARSNDGKHSRVVSRLSSGIATAARADADWVVTEFGAARLKGKSIRERVREMLQLAHPDDRERLESEAAQIPGFCR